MDMAIHPNSESTTGMASRNKAANSVRNREGVSDCVIGARDDMVLFTLTDPEPMLGERDPVAGGLGGDLCWGNS
jgi:hypothetical protein